MLDTAPVEAADSLHVRRHSCAHVLAAAVTELWPGTKYAIGPAIENGFYYDFAFPQPVSDTDLGRIQARMAEIIARDEPFERIELSREQAAAKFRELDQPYKLEILDQEAKEEVVVSCYRTGSFLDLCRGPHVASSAEIGAAFKLLQVAGAYWRGDEQRPQLTRIYGTAWHTRAELKEYLDLLAEAERRDHKRLGRELRLFALDDRAGPGLVLWLPNGATIRRELERWIVDEELARGYQHVVTPDVARLDLYRQSGHWQQYRDAMFPPMRAADGDEYELRPGNCPHHILVYQQEPRSYRDLPFRIAEIGNMYRYERSGELMGMIRVRAIALNDAHIFCTLDQLRDEITATLDLATYVLRTLGVTDYWHRLSIRDQEKSKYIGGDEQWASAEAALAGALEAVGADYVTGVGEAAFYGPKIDFQVRDAQRREFTNNTVQVDFQLPERFGLEYTDSDGSRRRPVMVHRAALGSMERLIAYLIEHYAGAFPTWLAPVQAAVLPITDAQLPYAREVSQRLRQAGVRVEVDSGPERIGKKIRSAQARKPPYMLVLGEREAESGTVSVRDRAGKQSTESVEDFAARIVQEIAERRLG